MAVEFRVLSDIEMRIDGRLVDVGHARQQCVLVALLVDANHIVPVDQLLDRVWGDHLPHRPRDTLHGYLSRLRQVLAAADDVGIARQTGGYVLTVEAMAVDLHRFHRLIDQARATNDEDRAAALFRQALGLWRGEAFDALDTAWLDTLRDILDAERLAAELEYNDLELRLGHHKGLLAELSARAAEHPLDERLASQLMLALYRCGRQADAMDHYRQVRLQLADELGADPSPPLQQLYQQILTVDPTLAVPAAIGTTPPPARPPAPRQLPAPPRQLPAPPRSFTGRLRELAELSSALDAQAGPGGTVMISAIGGMGGIGKTWLAVRWAHDNLERFPDGQLYVNLRGFDPSGEPVPPTLAVRGFLHALGVAPPAIPVDLGAQAALYRSLVADKRMLVVLDNARGTAQVMPLLPGGPTCTVLVTSRHQLAGLVAAHGARPLALDTLTEAEARQLLARHLGPHRVAAEPAAVNSLLAQCAGLPLALSIVAARAATQPDFPLAVLADEMQEASARLSGLDAGELSGNLAAVFFCSYQTLDPQTAETFRLVGLAPGPDISLSAAVSLVALPTTRTRVLLRKLQRVHLLQEHVPGRYRMHDLVRLYAAERAHHDQPEGTRAAALRRLVDFYLHTAHAGDRLLYPHRPPIELDPPAPGCVPHPLQDRATAMAWFDSNHACLLATQHLAVEHSWGNPVWKLAWALTIFHWRRGHIDHHLTAWQAGLTAAERLGDPTAQAQAHRLLGHAYGQAGEYTDALEHLQQSLTFSQQTDDDFGQAHTHQLLAWIRLRQNDPQQALSHAVCALRLSRTLHNPVWNATALETVGWCYSRLGNHQQALAYCERALNLHRQHHHHEGEAETLDTLGYVAHHTGQHLQALHHYQQALALHRDLGDTYAEADTLVYLSDVHTALGQHTQAHQTWQQALSLYQGQHRTVDATRARPGRPLPRQ